MDGYLTVAEKGEGLCVIQKSRFLSLCVHVTAEDEAMEAVASRRKRMHDARHHCYALVLGEASQLRRYGDDGEPQGTAGLPILEVLTRRGVTDTLIVVTRYFGGVLLGAPGLTRAYSQAAAAALNTAALVKMRLCALYRLETDYSRNARLPALLSASGAQAACSEYGEGVVHTVQVDAAKTKEFSAAMGEFLGGSGKLTFLGNEYRGS